MNIIVSSIGLRKYWRYRLLYTSFVSTINYHNFDEELVSDLPSCVYAVSHLSSSPVDNADRGSTGGIAANTVGTRTLTNLCALSATTLRQQLHHQYTLQQQQQQHSDYLDSPSTSMSSPVNLSASATNLSTYGGCSSPYKNPRQQTNVRERKRMMRSAPNG